MTFHALTVIFFNNMMFIFELPVGHGRDDFHLFIEECHNKPLAIVAKLKPVVFEQQPQPNISQQIIFGQNTNALTAASRGFQQLDSMPDE